MNSMMMTDTSSSVIEREIMSGLTKLDKTDNPVPDLATSWKVSDDKLTYTFELRKDPKWSNGDPVTAKDFAFAWKTTMDQRRLPNIHSFWPTILRAVDAFNTGKGTADQLGIKVVNDYELEVTLDKADSVFPESVRVPDLYAG